MSGRCDGDVCGGCGGGGREGFDDRSGCARGEVDDDDECEKDGGKCEDGMGFEG